jgi:hypothetical protein
MRLTGFTITDATRLEEKEKPIPEEVEKKINSFPPLSSVEDLFNRTPSTYDVLSIDFKSIYNLFALSKHSCRDAHAVGNWESTLIKGHMREIIGFPGEGRARH